MIEILVALFFLWLFSSHSAPEPSQTDEDEFMEFLLFRNHGELFDEDPDEDRENE